MITYREAITQAAALLATNPHLRETARADATTLLQIDRPTLLAHPDSLLTAAQQVAYDQATQRRLQNEPIQYILGHTEFYGLRLKVTRAVLIPRPETELLVEAALARIAPDARILDIGTGSGAIAIALAVHLPQASITAVDLSPEALAVARENARTHRVADRIAFLESDLLNAIAEVEQAERSHREAVQHGTKCFDAIASNPPYVPSTDAETLHPQVRDFEPAQALYAGPDGLEIYRRLIPQAREHLAPNGLLALEIGYGQRDAIAALLAGWREVEFLLDLQQIPRTVFARRA